MRRFLATVCLSVVLVSAGLANAVKPVTPDKAADKTIRALYLQAPQLSVIKVLQQNVKSGQAKAVRPTGVPAWWDWYDGANRPVGKPLKPGYTENVGYGIVHELLGSKQPNTAKAYLGPMQVWLYGADGQWRKVKDGPVVGAAYATDFKQHEIPWSITKAENNQVIIGEPTLDRNMHFWNEGPRGVARMDDVYVYTRYLAKASHNQALTACAGDDQYDGARQNPFAQSNHVLLTTQWQSIAYTNAPADILQKLPKAAF